MHSGKVTVRSERASGETALTEGRDGLALSPTTTHET